MLLWKEVLEYDTEDVSPEATRLVSDAHRKIFYWMLFASLRALDCWYFVVSRRPGTIFWDL